MIRRTAGVEPIWQFIVARSSRTWPTPPGKSAPSANPSASTTSGNPEERKRLELLHRYPRQHTRNLTGMPALPDYAKVAKRTRAVLGYSRVARHVERLESAWSRFGVEPIRRGADSAWSRFGVEPIKPTLPATWRLTSQASDLMPEEKAFLENTR